MREFTLALCGLGVVGSSVVKLLQQNSPIIQAKYGFTPKLVQVGARRPNPNCHLGDIERNEDIFQVAKDPRSQLLIETIGGVEDAYKLTMEAFANKKHVVTANKSLIAAKGDELFTAARDNGVGYFFEASVAGGIPIIKILDEGLSANKFKSIIAVLNGTGNYILTRMKDDSASFDEALKEAQELGYAEANPTLDIDSSDSLEKISILSALAFSANLEKIAQNSYKEGIERVDIEDISFAESLGYSLKQLAVAQRLDNQGSAETLSISVRPTFVPKESQLASLKGADNGIMINSDPLGKSFFSGAGAGGPQTASAIVADIVDASKSLGEDGIEEYPSHESIANRQKMDYKFLSRDDSSSEFYIKLCLEDEPGILAKVPEVFAELNIDIERTTKKPEEKTGEEDKKESSVSDNSQVTLGFITKRLEEKILNQAIAVLPSKLQTKKPIVHYPILSLSSFS